jgi:catechol 2,3-dioxygenase-like lactoylglutathione lyase family enzyme
LTHFQRAVPRLSVSDLKVALDFYVGLLGFELGSAWHDDGPTFAILQRGGVELQLGVPEHPDVDPPGRATVSFDVDDARGLHAELEGKVEIEWGPEVYWYGRREFAVRDPDGTLLLFSEQTSDPTT